MNHSHNLHHLYLAHMKYSISSLRAWRLFWLGCAGFNLAFWGPRHCGPGFNVMFSLDVRSPKSFSQFSQVIQSGICTGSGRHHGEDCWKVCAGLALLWMQVTGVSLACSAWGQKWERPAEQQALCQGQGAGLTWLCSVRLSCHWRSWVLNKMVRGYGICEKQNSTE